MSKQSEYMKEWRTKNKDTVLKRSRVSSAAYRKTHQPQVMLSRIRGRAKKNNIEFNLVEEDINIPEVCPILQIPLKGAGKVGPSPNSPSVDRIDPSRGYIKGNIQIISHKANTMKSDSTQEELLIFADWVQKTYGTMD